MDVSEPGFDASRPAPGLLYVHGGGWILGNRQPTGPAAVLAGQDGALFGPLRSELTGRGFVVASIDYRLAPIYPWPAQIEDAKCAVRFMRANATALGIDPMRIGTWGSSAGGQLVSLLGTASPAAGFDVGQYPDESSRVEAVVDMFGPSELNQMSDSNALGQFVFGVAFSGASAREREAASPVSHVAEGDPPFLILHGGNDMMVPLHHAMDLARALQAANVPVVLVIVKGTGHTLATVTEQPDPSQVRSIVVDFFSKWLLSAP
jgi:acetyl esterase/lipase